MEIGYLRTPGTVSGNQVGERRNGTLAALPSSHLKLLDGPVTGVMSTVKASGIVQLSPVWVLHDGTHVLINSVRGRHKDRNVRTRPQVSVALIDPDNPYLYLGIEGHVVDIVDEDDPDRGAEATRTINAMAKLYMDVDEYTLRDPSGEVRSLYYILPERAIVMG